MIELIRKLTEAWGPSGYEHQVRALIRQEVQDLADEITVDGMGNLICRVGSGGKKILVAAHMDEIGVMATYAEPRTNYLRFTNLGGLLFTTLHGSRVRFEDGTIGVIGAHDAFGKGRTSATDLENFYIDVQDETGESVIAPGSPAGFWRETQVRGQRVIAKSLDDRIGCVVAIETMRALKKRRKKVPNTVYFAFTTQEEVGLRGARVAGQGIQPDLGIALDVTATGDEIKNRKMAIQLGAGAAIKVIDSSLIVPPAIRDWMIARAEADKIPFQLELLTGGGTDAGAIQTAGSGVPSGCISIPTRFLHTPSETVDLRDVEACVQLLTGLVGNPVELNA